MEWVRRACTGGMSIDQIDGVLDAVKAVQDLIEEEKERLNDGLYVRLCNAMQGVYNHARALKPGGDGSDEDEDEDGDEGEGESDEESDEEPERERTEDDMELNELAELWGWQFDFGRPNAMRPLEDIIGTITSDDEVVRVCAAVRVLNQAVNGSKPDDPADAERILQWKEELVGEGAIKACAELLERVDERSFHTLPDWEGFLYSVLCDEIMQLFQRLGSDDALFRTKLRRNGALKGAKEYAKGNANGHIVQIVLDMLQRR